MSPSVFLFTRISGCVGVRHTANQCLGKDDTQWRQKSTFQRRGGRGGECPKLNTDAPWRQYVQFSFYCDILFSIERTDSSEPPPLRTDILCDSRGAMKVSGGVGICNGSQLLGALGSWYLTSWTILLLRPVSALWG